jgi:hypothetical protein
MTNCIYLAILTMLIKGIDRYEEGQI